MCKERTLIGKLAAKSYHFPISIKNYQPNPGRQQNKRNNKYIPDVRARDDRARKEKTTSAIKQDIGKHREPFNKQAHQDNISYQLGTIEQRKVEYSWTFIKDAVKSAANVQAQSQRLNGKNSFNRECRSVLELRNQARNIIVDDQAEVNRVQRPKN